jgi:hypothetical protein
MHTPARKGCCRRGLGCDRNDWLVTGPQVSSRLGESRSPWGTYHVKHNGHLVTACGEFAVGWHVFWNHEFSAYSVGACRACLREIRREAAASA